MAFSRWRPRSASMPPCPKLYPLLEEQGNAETGEAGRKPASADFPLVKTFYSWNENSFDVHRCHLLRGTEFPRKLRHRHSFPEEDFKAERSSRTPDYSYIHMISSMEFDKYSRTSTEKDCNASKPPSEEGDAELEGGAIEAGSKQEPVEPMCTQQPRPGLTR